MSVSTFVRRSSAEGATKILATIPAKPGAGIEKTLPSAPGGATRARPRSPRSPFGWGSRRHGRTPSSFEGCPPLRVLGALDRVVELDALAGLGDRGLHRSEQPVKEGVVVDPIEPKRRTVRREALQLGDLPSLDHDGEKREAIFFRLLDGSARPPRSTPRAPPSVHRPSGSRQVSAGCQCPETRVFGCARPGARWT